MQEKNCTLQRAAAHSARRLPRPRRRRGGDQKFLLKPLAKHGDDGAPQASKVYPKFCASIGINWPTTRIADPNRSTTQSRVSEPDALMR